MAESLHILLGTSACLQWLCHSGERTVARGPLVYCYYWFKHLFLCITYIWYNTNKDESLSTIIHWDSEESLLTYENLSPIMAINNSTILMCD